MLKGQSRLTRAMAVLPAVGAERVYQQVSYNHYVDKPTADFGNWGGPSTSEIGVDFGFPENALQEIREAQLRVVR